MPYGRTPKCPKCGRELVGLSLDYGSEWTCCYCAEDQEDPIFCERGCKVEFAYPDSGWEHEREEVKNLLSSGEIYTVESVRVGGYLSEIKLKEFPDTTFNSVFFRRVQ